MSVSCIKCGKPLFMAKKGSMCKSCRVEEGLPPFEFVVVDIKPFVKGKEIEEVYSYDDLKYIEKSTPEVDGFSITWVASGVGFSTATLWVNEKSQWCIDEKYSEEFFTEMMKFFFSKLEVEE